MRRHITYSSAAPITSATSAAPLPIPALAPLLRPAEDDDGDVEGDVVAFDVVCASEAEDVGDAELERLDGEAVEDTGSPETENPPEA